MGRAKVIADDDVLNLVKNGTLRQEDIYLLEPWQRGRVGELIAKESKYSGYLHSGAQRNGYFPTIDFETTLGDVVSYKTTNTTNKTWFSNFSRDMKKHIDKLAEDPLEVAFTPGVEGFSPRLITPNSRTLDILLEKGALQNDNVIDKLNSLRQYAQQSGVVLIFDEVV